MPDGDLVAVDSPVAVTEAVPSGTAATRVANDWYAPSPGSTPVTSREPYSVVSTTSTGTSDPLVARTATCTRPATQRADASAVTGRSAPAAGSVSDPRSSGCPPCRSPRTR